MKKIPDLKLSKKGYDLIEMYKAMVDEGYDNNLFNLKKFKEFIKKIFLENKIESVLDYGSGNTNWFDKNFDNETFTLKATLTESIPSFSIPPLSFTVT